MALKMRLMDSFSQRERFIWHDGVFTVIIPNGTRTAYHARASISYLKTLLIPQLRLTRAGNISSHQPPPPPPQPYDFYLAQLIHYGLDFHFEIEAAQRALEIEIRLGKLHVPSGLMDLEKELRRVHERKHKRDHKDIVRVATQQQHGSTVYVPIPLDTSKDEPEDKPAPRTAHRSPVKRKQARKEVIHTSDESEARSSRDQSSNYTSDDSGNESDTIAVAVDRHRGTSSDSSESSSSEDVPEVKVFESNYSGHHSINKESSEDADVKDTSSDDDPFLDKQNFKRVKIEKAEEKDDSILRSTREAAPFVGRRQLPPTQVKIRRIAYQPHVTAQAFHSAVKDTLGNQITNTTTFASTSKIPPRKPFVNPDKRPSWTMPVRSPSSSQQNTPKSVTFSQVQRETPTKVPEAEKATFSSAIETPQRTLYGRSFSPSSDYNHTTALHSILKKSTPHPSQTTVGEAGNTETSAHIPRENGASLSRPRKRKRKSQIEGGFHLDLDGTQETPDTPDDPYTAKPYITSDLVDGKPISSLGSDNRPRARQASSQHNISPLRSSAGRMAVNSKSSHRQLRPNSDGKQNDVDEFKNSTLAKMKKNRRLKGEEQYSAKDRNSFGTAHGYEHGQQRAFGLNGGSGSRGGLVRAGAAF